MLFGKTSATILGAFALLANGAIIEMYSDSSCQTSIGSRNVWDNTCATGVPQACQDSSRSLSLQQGAVISKTPPGVHIHAHLLRLLAFLPGQLVHVITRLILKEEVMPSAQLRLAMWPSEFARKTPRREGFAKRARDIVFSAIIGF
jgi:hypothetical protein